MNSKKLTIKDSALSFLIGFLLCQIAIVSITIIVLFVGRFYKFGSEELDVFLNTASGYLITSTVMYATLLFVFLFYNNKKENKIAKRVEIKKVLMYVGIAILSYFLLFPIVTCFNNLLTKFGVEVGSLKYELSTKNYLISIISLAVLPAVCEELLFRGLIFKGLKPHGKAFSITISSLMFCIFHMSLSQTIYPILMGLLFGVIMFYENNIYYCIIAHFTNNILSLTLSYFKINLVFNHWTFILLAIILLLIFLTVIIFLILKNNKSTEKQPIENENKKYLTLSLGVMILFWILVNLI